MGTLIDEETASAKSGRDETHSSDNYRHALSPDYGQNSTGLVGEYSRHFDDLINDLNSTNNSENTNAGQYYVESATTGRFRRYVVGNDGVQRWREKPRHKNLASDHIFWSANRKEALTKIRHSSYVSFLFLQGVLAGQCIQSMYEAFIVASAKEFIIQYMHRANENRRFYFIAISLCAMGSLCMIDENAIERVLCLKKSGMTSNIVNHNGSVPVLVLVYFIALIVTLPCSIIDHRISNLTFESNQDAFFGDVDDVAQSVLDGVNSWKGLAVTRSVFCIIGWLVSCHRLYQRSVSDR